jgi:hypothetical protein
MKQPLTQEQKGILYDDLLREGDRVNRKISSIKSNVFLTPDQEKELAILNKEVLVLESRLQELFNQG